jgi:hypothetical protein
MNTMNDIEACAHEERTDVRIRAYLASMRPKRGCDYGEEIEEQIHRGRSPIEKLALSAEDDDAPSLRLSADQCTDILTYMSSVEPINPATWWDDENGISKIAGLNFVFDVMADSLYQQRAAAATGDVATDKITLIRSAGGRKLNDCRRLAEKINEDLSAIAGLAALNRRLRRAQDDPGNQLDWLKGEYYFGVVELAIERLADHAELSMDHLSEELPVAERAR